MLAMLPFAAACSVSTDMANAEAQANSSTRIAEGTLAPSRPQPVPASPLAAPAPASPPGMPTVGADPGRPVAMCYRDYCPCQPPQYGTDMILCDQLRRGVQPEERHMIIGRELHNPPPLPDIGNN